VDCPKIQESKAKERKEEKERVRSLRIYTGFRITCSGLQPVSGPELRGIWGGPKMSGSRVISRDAHASQGRMLQSELPTPRLRRLKT